MAQYLSDGLSGTEMADGPLLRDLQMMPQLLIHTLPVPLQNRVDQSDVLVDTSLSLRRMRADNAKPQILICNIVQKPLQISIGTCHHNRRMKLRVQIDIISSKLRLA